MTGKAKTLRSTEVARMVGVSPDTLRLYERRGLFKAPPRSENGYRSYPPESIDRIRLIRAALSVGFTLDELSEVLTARDHGGIPCRRVRELAGKKLRSLDDFINELTGLRKQLQNVVRQWDAALKKTPPSQRAGLLESLAAVARLESHAARPLYSPFSRTRAAPERKR